MGFSHFLNVFRISTTSSTGPPGLKDHPFTSHTYGTCVHSPGGYCHESPFMFPRFNRHLSRWNMCPPPRWLLPQIDLLSTRTFYRFTYFSIQGSGRSPKSCFVTLRRCSTISRTTALRCRSTTRSSLDPASCLVPDG